MNLSRTQEDILFKMKNGWQLGESISFQFHQFWLQKGGCGRGGESKNVSSASVHALLDRNLIKKDKEEFPLRTYKIP